MSFDDLFRKDRASDLHALSRREVRRVHDRLSYAQLWRPKIPPHDSNFVRLLLSFARCGEIATSGRLALFSLLLSCPFIDTPVTPLSGTRILHPHHLFPKQTSNQQLCAKFCESSFMGAPTLFCRNPYLMNFVLLGLGDLQT